MSLPAPRTEYGTRGYQPKRFNLWYDAVIDYLFMNPTASNPEIAKHFGVTAQAISYIRNADVFLERYEQRKSEMNQHINEAVVQRAGKVAIKGLDAIEKQLDNHKDGVKTIKIETLADVTTKALAALGYGPKTGPTVQVNNQIVQANGAASEATVLEARQRIRQSQMERAQTGSEVLDLSSLEVPAEFELDEVAAVRELGSDTGDGGADLPSLVEGTECGVASQEQVATLPDAPCGPLDALFEKPSR